MTQTPTRTSFEPALTHGINWSTGQNRFDENGKQPRSLSLFIPAESIYEFAEYLQRLANCSDKIKTGKVWDFEKKERREVDGFYIYAKGREGNDGDFGQISPAQLPAAAPVSPEGAVDLPF